MMSGQRGVWVRLVLLAIVLVYFAIGLLYATETPDWQVPDEPAHYNYVRQLAEKRPFPCFPVLRMGDYWQSQLSVLVSEGFPQAMSIQEIEYEDHQPPLYYLLATPVFWLFDGALLPLRFFSLLLGAGVIVLAWAVAQALFPQRPLVSLGAAAFVAFLPQHVSIMAGVNNDALAELLIGVVLWMGLRLAQGRVDEATRTRHLLVLGVVLGLGLATKATVYAVALPLAALAVLFEPYHTSSEEETLPQATRVARGLLLVFIPALLIALPWWLRNVGEYGGIDVLGLANHDAVVAEQPRTTDWIDQYGWSAWLERGATFTFQSFWGQFGWMHVLMPTWLYRGLALWSAALLVGFALWGIERRATLDKRAWLLLATVAVFTLLAYLYYNRSFVQHQGRYLYPALIPIALAVALAVDVLVGKLCLPERLHAGLFALLFAGLVALDLYALVRVILPALT